MKVLLSPAISAELKTRLPSFCKPDSFDVSVICSHFLHGGCMWRIKEPQAKAGRGNKQTGQRCPGFASLYLPARHWPKPKSLSEVLELIFRRKISSCKAQPWDLSHSQQPKKGAGEWGQTSAWPQALGMRHRQGAFCFRQHGVYLVCAAVCACLLVKPAQSSLWKLTNRRCSLTKPTSEKHWEYWAPALPLIHQWLYCMQHNEPGRYCANKYNNCREWICLCWPHMAWAAWISTLWHWFIHLRKNIKTHSKTQTHQPHIHHWPYIEFEIF